MTDAVESISAFFPCYNDAPSIGDVVRTAYQTLEDLGVDFEVIVIDDGSSDDSCDVVEALRDELPRVRLVRHPMNRGYGGAILSGFATARKQWVFYTDGDGQYDPSELAMLVKEARADVDVVQGYKLRRSDPLNRKIIGRLYHRAVVRIFHLDVRDTDCDFRLIRRDLIEKIQLFHTSGVICVEMVYRFQEAGGRFVEVPVHHFPRVHGSSQFFRPRKVVRALGGLLMFRAELVLEKHRASW